LRRVLPFCTPAAQYQVHVPHGRAAACGEKLTGLRLRHLARARRRGRLGWLQRPRRVRALNKLDERLRPALHWQRVAVASSLTQHASRTGDRTALRRTFSCCRRTPFVMVPGAAGPHICAFPCWVSNVFALDIACSPAALHCGWATALCWQRLHARRIDMRDDKRGCGNAVPEGR